MNEIIEKIRDYDRDIKATEVRLKDLKDDLKEKIENTEAGETVAKLKDSLKIAQEDLISELKRNPDVNNLLEEIGAEAEVLKSQKFHLSEFLVSYFADKNEKQVQMDDEGHAKDIILSAKLGKEEHQYQESLFNPDRKITMQVGDGPKIPINNIKRR